MTAVAELDEITYDLEVDGDEVRRTLHRRIWERRGWATVAIAYQEKAATGWVTKLALLRMKRRGDAWIRHAAITLRGDDARDLGAQLAAWSFEGDGAGDDDGE